MIQASISALCLIVVLSYVDLSNVGHLIASADATLLVILFLVFAGDRAFMAWKWLLLLRSTGYQLRYYHALRAYYVASFVGTALPLGGLGSDLVRYVLLRELHIPPKTIACSIVVERVLGLVGTLFMVVLGLVVFYLIVPNPEWKSWIGMLILACTGACGALIAVIFCPALRSVLLRYSFTDRLLRRRGVSSLVDEFGQYGRRPGTLAFGIGLSFLEQLFPMTALFVAARAIDMPVEIVHILAVVPVAIVLERLPFTIGGVGVREGVFVILFGAFGIDAASAVALGLIIFTLYVFSLLPGAVWLRTNRKALKDSPATVLRD